MAKTYKTADAARAAYKPKKETPKGGGKGAKGYKLYTPVKQSTINNIKSMGMTAALKKAGSSKNAEFVQGVKRMYGVKRLEASMAKAKKSAPSKSPDAARAKYIGTGSNKAKMTTLNKMKAKPKYTSKNPKPMGPGGLKPGALGFLKNKYEK